jgi:hypothetical protein
MHPQMALRLGGLPTSQEPVLTGRTNARISAERRTENLDTNAPATGQ